jgi:hypothetical protein
VWKEFNIKFYATTINDKTPEQPNEIILIIYFNFRRSLINHSSVDKGRTNNINARRPFPVKERNEEKIYINGDGQQFRSRVIGLDMTEDRIFTLCRMIT